MENFKLCKSSQNLRVVEGSISKSLCIHKRNNLSHNENMDEKNILFNFISSKNKITLKTCFDQKGSKKFLSDKEKAMAFLELSDNIIEDKKKKKKKRHSRKDTKRKTKHRSESQKLLIYVVIKRINHINEDRKEPEKKMISDKTVGLLFAQNYKKHKKKSLITNSEISDIKGGDSLNLASDHNDSFIHSILKELIIY